MEGSFSKKVKTPHGFPSFFLVSHAGVGFWKVLTLGLFFCFSLSCRFWKVLVRNSKELCYGRFGLGKLTQQKKLQRRGRPCNVRNPWHSEGGAGKEEVEHGSERIQFKARPVHWLTKGGLDAGITRPPFAHQCTGFALTWILSLPCSTSSFPAPPSLCHGFLTLHFDFASPGPCPGRRPQALACFKYNYTYIIIYQIAVVCVSWCRSWANIWIALMKDKKWIWTLSEEKNGLMFIKWFLLMWMWHDKSLRYPILHSSAHQASGENRRTARTFLSPSPSSWRKSRKHLTLRFNYRLPNLNQTYGYLDTRLDTWTGYLTLLFGYSSPLPVPWVSHSTSARGQKTRFDRCQKMALPLQV